MSGFYDDLIIRARDHARNVDSAAEVVRWLDTEITRMLGGRRALLPIVSCLVEAFDIEFGVALSVQRWAGFGYGGDLSDEDLNRRFGRLIPRTVNRVFRSLLPQEDPLDGPAH